MKINARHSKDTDNVKTRRKFKQKGVPFSKCLFFLPLNYALELIPHLFLLDLPYYVSIIEEIRHCK